MAQANRKPQAAGTDAHQLLRLMPSVDECLAALLAEESSACLRRDFLLEAVREAQNAARAGILAGDRSATARGELLDLIVARAREFIAADRPAWRTVINATGVVIHTNLGRAILAPEAIAAAVRAARAPINLEYDLASGERGDRDRMVERELCALCGAPAATVVNNNAAAVLLALNSLAEGREVIVSRGELIEIGGSFRIPDVMEKSGARLREVGTTNRTHPRDYAAAINAQTGLLLKVHPSNYRIEGFTAAVELEHLCELGRKHGVPVMEDLGSGALVDLARYGLRHEPTVKARLAAGADLVTFSGDKLLGGPQAGIIAGKRELIERIKRNPLKRALRCDKLTLAALSATLRLYLRSANLTEALPTLRFLTRTADELEAIALRAKEILGGRLGSGFEITVGADTSEAGSGSMPGDGLETRVLRVSHPDLPAQRIAALFRAARPPVIGRIHNGVFQLDMRTIEDPAILAVTFYRS